MIFNSVQFFIFLIITFIIYYMALEENDYIFNNESEFTNNEAELYRKNKEYLYKIINLTKKEEINLIIVKTPTSYTNEEMSKLNYIKRIAKENDILFLDYINNINDLNLEYDKDFYDSGYLNKNGSIKLTKSFIDNLE